ncbi:MAG TPA: hypothetical protein VMH87_17685 [Pseudomonadales bacterium]|nr:hypothetical protein [Pseudomonadales bacterium]
MNNDTPTLLSVRRLPGRINVDQAAQLLGFMPHDIPILIKAKLLKPLGKPVQQAAKYFAAIEVERLAQEEAWLDRATMTIYKYLVGQNQRRIRTVGATPLIPERE